MNLKLTRDELAALRDCLKIQVQQTGEVLKDHDSFSHGDWLRFEHDLQMYKSILKKTGVKKWLSR